MKLAAFALFAATALAGCATSPLPAPTQPHQLQAVQADWRERLAEMERRFPLEQSGTEASDALWQWSLLRPITMRG
ncbi:hypothetical protein [Sabulicella glaciei]|uniref:Uncharacterized protein n=1 Tax=Sabulicella glaciei TaxID=2984948 RepID=A0ABT3NZL9_9PROT|nr:hypothetical protein [Roseococcus sp. MDT2-1-1]MCW8087545.1 hypothetical protein [Roseococcus sp. MDT2-1-1]